MRRYEKGKITEVGTASIDDGRVSISGFSFDCSNSTFPALQIFSDGSYLQCGYTDAELILICGYGIIPE